MSEKASTISSNGDARKDKVNGRLQSIFNSATSRDLSLLKTNQRAQTSKRIYTPNLNAVRHKQTEKPAEPSMSVQSRKTRGRGGKNNNNNHMNPRKNPNLHQTVGCFSDGFSGPAMFRGSRERMGNTRENIASEVLQKPRIIKRDTKPEKSVLEHEQRTLAELLGDENDDLISDEHGSESSSDDLRPIEIKEIKDSNTSIDPNKLDVGTLKIKQEPVDDDVEMALSTESPDFNGITIKTEPGIQPKSEAFLRMDKLFNASPADFFMFQMPDALPGREPEPADIKPEQSKEPQTSTPVAASSSSSSTTSKSILCTLNHLREGRIGKLVRHASGRTRLVIGDISYDVTEGLTSDFTQHAATIYSNRTERSANIINLGEIKSKFNVTPDWNELLERRAT